MHLSLTDINQSRCKTANSLDATNMRCSGGFWRSQNLTIVRSPVGDWCQVYRLPCLGMQLKANSDLRGALERPSAPQGQPTALLWETGDVIPGLGRFLESYLPTQFSLSTPWGISAAARVLRIEPFIISAEPYLDMGKHICGRTNTPRATRDSYPGQNSSRRGLAHHKRALAPTQSSHRSSDSGSGPADWSSSNQACSALYLQTLRGLPLDPLKPEEGRWEEKYETREMESF